MPPSAPSDAGLGGQAWAERARLTSLYLDEVARRGQTADDLMGIMPTTGRLYASYKRRWVPRPLFIGHAEASQVNSDLQHIRVAMNTLPDLLYDGDLIAFAKDSGLTEIQAEAVLRTRTEQISEWARADMYPDADGLKLLEFNMGSGIGGSECGAIVQAMLRYPLLREFADTHKLTHVDTMEESIRLLFAETGCDPGSNPRIALVDSPEHYAVIGKYLHSVSRFWRSRGLDTHACHIGQLKLRNGQVWLRGKPVDIIFRIFLLEDLLKPGVPEVMFPVLDAVVRGEVALFSPLDGELFGSKLPLAMLSEHANRHLFTPAQLAAFDRVLPWTRVMRPGPVTLEDGSSVDLMDYALGHPEDLLIKPALLHGGIGVLAGWDPATTEGVWRHALEQAMGEAFVIQRRVKAIPELAPGEDGELFAWDTTWGVFTSAAGFGGVWARGFPAQTGAAVARVGTGLRITGILIGPPDAPAQA
jgi:hypothetical protein